MIITHPMREINPDTLKDLLGETPEISVDGTFILYSVRKSHDPASLIRTVTEAFGECGLAVWKNRTRFLYELPDCSIGIEVKQENPPNISCGY
jgi:hypothetical protein